MEKMLAKKIVLETRKLRESLSQIVLAGKKKGGVDLSAIREVEKKLFNFLAAEWNVSPITLRCAVEQSMQSSADADAHDEIHELIVHENALAFGIEEKFIHMGIAAFLSIHSSF